MCLLHGMEEVPQPTSLPTESAAWKNSALKKRGGNNNNQCFIHFTAKGNTHMIFCVFLLFVCDVFSYSCCDVVVIVLAGGISSFLEVQVGFLGVLFGNSISLVIIKCVQMKQLLPQGWQKPSVMPFLDRWCGSYSS